MNGTRFFAESNSFFLPSGYGMIYRISSKEATKVGYDGPEAICGTD